MEEKDKQPQKPAKESCIRTAEEFPLTFGNFTTKESWDLYFATKESDDFSEWYADWPQLEYLLVSYLVYPLSLLASAPKEIPPPDVPPEELRILVPACGNSRMSENLYDRGFRKIINVDYSRVVISAMLRRNVIQRPEMKWRVMDMISMQFENETFDAIVDKGGLDILIDPGFGQIYPNIYLTKVKELLKVGGKYICFTLGESKSLGLLFHKFRFGWKMDIYDVDREPSSRNLDHEIFMLIAEKDGSTFVYHITPLLDTSKPHGNQAQFLYGALKRENALRRVYMETPEIFYPLEDLRALGNFRELQPGRRVKLMLGDPGISRLIYKGILLDAKGDSGPFSLQFGVFIVPKVRSLQWIPLSEEGQWIFLEHLKAARLLMILLDSRDSYVAIEDIQSDLSPLVKQLAPGNYDDEVPIPFVVASDGIKQGELLYQATSVRNGPIAVDDVILEKLDDALIRHFPHKELKFRRLIVRDVVQAEAVLSIEGPNESSSEVERNDVQATSETKKKGKQKISDSHSSRSHASSGEMKVQHKYLDSLYHNGIISGLMLVSLHLKGSTSSGGLVKTVVLGLKAGLLPMFMKNCLPFLHIEVVEIDPMLLDVAREYFGFKEDEHLKVHISDAIKFVSDIANSEAGDHKVDLLVVDVDALPSAAMLSPAPCFLEDSFLLTAKNSLSEEGLYAVHLVSSFSPLKVSVTSTFKKVFGNVFSLQLGEDVDEVIFAMNKDSLISEDELSAACDRLARSLELEKPAWGQRVIDASKLIKPVMSYWQ